MKEPSTPNNRTNRLTIVLFVVYLIALYWILLLKLGVRFSYMGDRKVNLIPFNKPSILTGENMMNVVIFIPLGIYAGILFQRWAFSKKLLFVFLVTLIVEVLQYILRIGALDATDLVTNTLGGVIGLMTFGVVEKVFDNRIKAQQFINIIAALGTVFMILFFVLLKLNMLPVRYQ